MKAVFDWLDHRTGYKKIVHESLFENVPGGSRWRYVWGSTLTFTLVVQFITGIFLWMAYNPSSQTAWESVYYIQYEMTGGWLLRGIHHFTAHAMIVLLVLHLMQVVIDGAYKAPREVNFWFGFFLLLLVMGLSLTGYLLPWDQKGFWATKVATSIASITPVIGPFLQKLIAGGPEYGHHTLSRFFALHAGVLPGLIIVLLVGHIYMFRRHGLTAKQPVRRPDEAFWPNQVLKDAVACLAVMAAVLILVLYYYGAPLGAPADPSEPYSAARSEWYYLFLFQLLKYFPGGSELWGAIILPGIVALLVFLMPVIGRWKLGHRFNLGLLGALVLSIGLLTYLAIAQDRANPVYLAGVEQAERAAERIKVLAQGPNGIPVTGAAALLREDPFIQGPKLFAQNCASCHRYDGHDGLGLIPVDPQSASDLMGFGSREWLTGFFDPERISTHEYFGGTDFENGTMADFIKMDIAEFPPEMKAELDKAIIALSAEAGLKSQRTQDEADAAIIAEGRELIAGFNLSCTDCHTYRETEGDGTAPLLTGYASREWMINFVSNPAHPDLYGSDNDRMPAYVEEGILTTAQVGLVVDWLRGEWYEPGDAPESAPVVVETEE